MNILVCGYRAFAAKGLIDFLKKKGHTVFGFSRGNIAENAFVVTGPVNEIDSNPYLKEKNIDVIINFIVLKDRTVDDNLSYIAALCRLSKEHQVSKLIQISSISSYPNDMRLINENSEIEHDGKLKGGYGALKVEVDRFLIKEKKLENIPVIFVRPGFIMAVDHPNPLGGIVKTLPYNWGIIWGDKESTLPVVCRKTFHISLTKIVEDNNPLDVYILIEKGIKTKADYAIKVCPNLRLISLPKKLMIGLAFLLFKSGLLNRRRLNMVRGLFKVQEFNTNITENKII